MLKKSLYVLTLPFVFSGCVYHVDDPAYHQHTVTDKKVDVVLMTNKDKLNKKAQLSTYIDNNSELKAMINSRCSPHQYKPKKKQSEGIEQKSFAATPILASMAPSLVKLAFDIEMDKSEKALDQLKEKSSRSYSNKVILSSNEFREKSCAVIYRYDPRTNEPGLISLLKLDNYSTDQGFTLTPLYVKAVNTISLSKEAKINASMAMSVKAINRDKEGWPVLKSVGEGSVTVQNIPLDKNSTNACKKDCESSELIPYLSGSDHLLSVTMSVVETGDIGMDIDDKKAEMKAIKDAIGPALKESTKLMFN